MHVSSERLTNTDEWELTLVRPWCNHFDLVRLAAVCWDIKISWTTGGIWLVDFWSGIGDNRLPFSLERPDSFYKFLAAFSQPVFQVLGPKYAEAWFDLDGRTIRVACPKNAD